MGYSTSLEAISRVKGFLQTLKDTKENQIAWKCSDPKTVQYQLHNGLSSAKRLKDERFQELKDLWKIKVRDNILIAERKVALDTPIASLIFEDVGDVYGVITKATLYKNQDSELIFTNVSLSEDDLEKINNWCKNYDFIARYDITTLSMQRIL